jgi:hypothetical protein
VKERTPPVQSLNDLEQTLHQEWQRLTQVQIRRQNLTGMLQIESLAHRKTHFTFKN